MRLVLIDWPDDDEPIVTNSNGSSHNSQTSISGSGGIANASVATVGAEIAGGGGGSGITTSPYDRLIRRSRTHFEAFIFDLRTLTNYTFQVRPGPAGDLPDEPQLQRRLVKRPVEPPSTKLPRNSVVVETKGCKRGSHRLQCACRIDLAASSGGL